MDSYHYTGNQPVLPAGIGVRRGRPGSQGGGQGRRAGSLLQVTVWCLSWLQAEQGEGLHAGAVPAEFAAGSGVVRPAVAVQDADDGAGDGGAQAGGGGRRDPGGGAGRGWVAP